MVDLASPLSSSSSSKQEKTHILVPCSLFDSRIVVASAFLSQIVHLLHPPFFSVPHYGLEPEAERGIRLYTLIRRVRVLRFVCPTHPIEIHNYAFPFPINPPAVFPSLQRLSEVISSSDLIIRFPSTFLCLLCSSMSGCIPGARSLPGLPSVLRCLTLYHAFHSNSVLGPHQKSPSPADSSTQDHFQPPPSPAFLVVTISIVRLDNPTRRILRNELPFTAQSSLNETTRLLCSLPQIGRRYPVTHATQRKKKLIKIGLLYTHTHVCKHCAPPPFFVASIHGWVATYFVFLHVVLFGSHTSSRACYLQSPSKLNNLLIVHFHSALAGPCLFLPTFEFFLIEGLWMRAASASPIMSRAARKQCLWSDFYRRCSIHSPLFPLNSFRFCNSVYFDCVVFSILSSISPHPHPLPSRD